MPDDAPLPASYEAARDELLEVVRRLETGSATLEESLSLWERGEALANACQQWLDGATARLDAAADHEATRSGAGEPADPSPGRP